MAETSYASTEEKKEDETGLDYVAVEIMQKASSSTGQAPTSPYLQDEAKARFQVKVIKKALSSFERTVNEVQAERMTKVRQEFCQQFAKTFNTLDLRSARFAVPEQEADPKHPDSSLPTLLQQLNDMKAYAQGMLQVLQARNGEVA